MAKWKPWYILEKEKPWWQRYLFWLTNERSAMFYHCCILTIIFGIFNHSFLDFRGNQFAIMGADLCGAMLSFFIVVLVVSSIVRKFASITFREHRAYTLLLRVEDGKVTETGHALWGKKGILKIASKELLEYCPPNARLVTEVVKITIKRKTGSGTTAEEEQLTLPLYAFLTQGSALSLQELYDKVFSKKGTVKEYVTQKLRETVAVHETEITRLLYEFKIHTTTSEELLLGRVVDLLQIERPFDTITSAEIYAGPIAREIIRPEKPEIKATRTITYA